MSSDAGSCRLCGGTLAHSFTLEVLHKYQVGYLTCASCGSLQTEPPYWLDEAYGPPPADEEGAKRNLNNLDVGAVQRNLSSHAATMFVARMLKVRNIVDHGGGDGLLCRLLRDHGMNAFVNDPHATPVYAQGFMDPPFASPDIVTAFEVWEHFADPQADLQAVFGGKPLAVLVSTLTYRGEGSDWWYLIPETGHHVFFYSLRAFEVIAERFGYELIRQGAYMLFVRSGHLTTIRRKLIYRGLKNGSVRAYRGVLALAAVPGVDRDFEYLSARSA